MHGAKNQNIAKLEWNLKLACCQSFDNIWHELAKSDDHSNTETIEQIQAEICKCSHHKKQHGTTNVCMVPIALAAAIPLARLRILRPPCLIEIKKQS